jgi:hypothetical protein
MGITEIERSSMRMFGPRKYEVKVNEENYLMGQYW